MRSTVLGTYHLTTGYEFNHNDSEVAAWYTRLRFEPQSVEVTAQVNDLGRIEQVGYTLTGTVTDEYHAALFGGVPVSSTPYVPRGLGETRTYHVSMYGYNFAQALIDQRQWYTLKEPRKGYFVVTAPVEITSTPTLWHSGHSLLPNPRCECGQAIVRPLTSEERESYTDTLSRPDYAHTDGTPCTLTWGNGSPRPAWPAQDQWITYDEPGVHYTVKVA